MRQPRFLAGASWALVNAGASVLVPTAIFVVFARTVDPVLIGVIAMAAAWTEILKTFGMPGLYEALLQEPEARRESQETALFLLLFGGIALALLYLILLLAMAALLGSVAANFTALAFIGLRIPLDLVALQPQSVLAHRLSYGTLALRAVIGNAAAGAIGIAVVVLHGGIAGPIAYQVSQSAISFLVCVVGTRALAYPRSHPAARRRMLREASLSTGVRCIAATINNLDQIIVAALVGSLPLAYFNLGKRIETAFVTAGSSFASILFQPLFAKTESAAHRAAVRKALAIVTFTCGLPAVIFASNSELIVRLVFGRNWMPAAPVAAALAINGFVRAAGFVPGALMSVSRRNRHLLITSAVSGVAGAALVFATARFGLVWCATALIVKNTLVVGWMALWLWVEIGEPVSAYLTRLALPFTLMLAIAQAGAWLAGGSATGAHAAPQPALAMLLAVPVAVASAGYLWALLMVDNRRIRIALPRWPLRAMFKPVTELAISSEDRRR